jgi:hypothetical protein
MIQGNSIYLDSLADRASQDKLFLELASSLDARHTQCASNVPTSHQPRRPSVFQDSPTLL